MLRLTVLGGLSIDSSSSHSAGSPVGAPLTGRRPLALLALLSTAPNGLSRDKILGYLWPESDIERARNALNQLLLRVRREVAEPDVIVGRARVELNPQVVDVDVRAFEDACRARDLERAVDAYGGAFLDGFYLSDAPEFDRWVESERARLASMYVASLQRLAGEAETRGDDTAAIGWLRRLAAAEPASTPIARWFVDVLARHGDLAAALRAAQAHETLLREELGVAPDENFLKLLDRLRAEAAPPRPHTPPLSATPVHLSVVADTLDAETPKSSSAPKPRSKPPGHRARLRTLSLRIAGLLAVVMASAALGATWEARRLRAGDSAVLIDPNTRSAKRLSPTSAEGSCAIVAGHILCWGGNDDGQLGDGTTTDRATPVPVKLSNAADVAFIEVHANQLHTCALTAAGDTYCWGSNSHGQLGVPNIAGTATPVRVAAAPRFAHLVTGRYHSCGLTRDGTAHCWGWNNYGQLGAASIAGATTTPTPVSTTLRFASLSAGYLHTCGITLNGDGYCWGSNVEGQVGIGQDADSDRVVRTPRLVSDKISFTKIVTGNNHTCAIGEDAAAYCWGYNAFYQLGMPSPEKCGRPPYQVPCSSRPSPVSTALRFASLAVGQFHTCGITASSEAFCWGQNDGGQLGDGSTSGSLQPVRVVTDARFTELAGGYHHTCGVTTDARILCWGANARGQLGDGTTADHRMPRPIK